MIASERHVIWGSELSPFALKLRATCDYAALPYDWLPAAGGRMRNYRIAWTIDRAKRRRRVWRYPQPSDLDEYPLVPFLVEPGGRVSYDSSALARWIDDQHPPSCGPLHPEEPALRFVARLIDEAFDEFGLYMAHHNRWVLSAETNDAGARLAREFSRVLLPGTGGAFARRFSRRQVRRLPYLFSVAPAGLSMALERGLVPPTRDGFPDTHAVLDVAWARYLQGVESILSHQPYLLGARFTIADASVYGQLGMNLKDPTAAERMRSQAPVTSQWLCDVRDGRHAGRTGTLHLDLRLRALCDVIAETFMTLMAQNENAYVAASRRGETLFNERAFDRGRALYDGELLGRPFRSVAKTFQVQVWRDLRDAWASLDRGSQSTVSALAGDADRFVSLLAGR
jgi:glutathione S-transferase